MYNKNTKEEKIQKVTNEKNTSTREHYYNKNIIRS